MRIFTAIVLTLLSTHTFSASWHCRNNDFDIRCNSGECQSLSGFTPLDIYIKPNQTLTVCAYSGCWEGKGTLSHSGKFLFMTAKNMQWTGTQPSTAEFLLAIDTSDTVGFIKGEGFATPVICTRQTQ